MGLFSKKDKETKHNDTLIKEILEDKMLCTMIIGIILVVLFIIYKFLLVFLEDV